MPLQGQLHRKDRVALVPLLDAGEPPVDNGQLNPQIGANSVAMVLFRMRRPHGNRRRVVSLYRQGLFKLSSLRSRCSTVYVLGQRRGVYGLYGAVGDSRICVALKQRNRAL